MSDPARPGSAQRIWAAVPFRGPVGSKRRLAGLLDASERERLSLAMLADVLDVLLDVHQIERVLLLRGQDLRLLLQRGRGEGRLLHRGVEHQQPDHSREQHERHQRHERQRAGVGAQPRYDGQPRPDGLLDTGRDGADAA